MSSKDDKPESSETPAGAEAETVDDAGLDAPDPARIFATGTGGRNPNFAPLSDGLSVLKMPDDPDTEETPPTAVPGEFSFDLDWEDDSDGDVETTFDGSEFEDDPDQTADDLMPPDATFDDAMLDDDDDMPTERMAVPDEAALDDAAPLEVAPKASGTGVPAWLVALAFFVLGMLLGEVLLG